VVKVKSQLVGVTRQVPQLQYFLSREHAMNSSFPSGDAAGSMTFAVVGLAVAPAEYR
jgi:membrane-associated phospholipid phosphatase